MPSMAQHEATIPVEVFVVQSDANGLFFKNGPYSLTFCPK
jgi:hypothetical protein